MIRKAVIYIFIALFALCGTAWAQALSLSNEHCVFCHKKQPATIDAKGGKHKTEVGCLDCHIEHPPEGQNAVPECSMCHSGKPHYDLENCGSCHSDTHAPLDLTIEGEVSEPCLSCHEQQGIEVRDYPSAHTDVACNECHIKHKYIPQCTECHEKHSVDMDQAACLSCHPVHKPLEITYDMEMPSRYCTSCHGEAGSLLAANTTKHHELSCVFCHRDRHTVKFRTENLIRPRCLKNFLSVSNAMESVTTLKNSKGGNR